MENLQSVASSYTVTLEEDSETKDLILPFPDSLIKELKWEINDTLSFELNIHSPGFIIKNISLEDRQKKSL